MISIQHTSEHVYMKKLTRISEQVIFDLMVLKCDERGS